MVVHNVEVTKSEQNSVGDLEAKIERRGLVRCKKKRGYREESLVEKLKGKY